MTETAPFTEITGLNALDGSSVDSARPDISMMWRNEDVIVIRLAFRAGQTMPDHRAGKPILVFGQTGRIDFTIGDASIVLEPGSAVHVDAKVVHSLHADTDAVATLVVLESSGS
ncbi:cupin domain-containing protein [Gordonia pseudamarae]|jgi:quercetin dioxygenase-like cupin family protein|uniref:Cupin domain-containing protein n=1 Tax=Gordonia pseudamarae TaxID=2831662 RepID=A0ABX6IFB4_9ACTN|nr:MULTISPECIES: cupin domain-containing protein [Gordonia]MBD0022012.1 cupin domain-containing protein [Gordonia sp. (in: high G+C Gram-positive bacteria)]QHN24873.1 cupin domain-containing protein [Gordonia pseudamarae]QHN33806.1 cupin domain-containing protein [Gordonia pseudamarae]